MRTYDRRGWAAGLGLSATRSRRLVGLAALAALLSLVIFQTDEALAQGRGEDVRLNLFLDTEGLIDPQAKEEEAPEPSQNLTEGKKPPEKPGTAPTGGSRWEWDPIFLQSREIGDPRKSEIDFRDSQFGIEVRRLF